MVLQVEGVALLHLRGGREVPRGRAQQGGLGQGDPARLAVAHDVALVAALIEAGRRPGERACADGSPSGGHQHEAGPGGGQQREGGHGEQLLFEEGATYRFSGTITTEPGLLSGFSGSKKRKMLIALA